MTTRQYFIQIMAERRKFARGTPDHEYRTRAARKYIWLMRNIPMKDWPA